MASPQTQNGYTKIANELLEALAHIRIPGEAMQIFQVVVRKTYGFNKKEDAIALSQFCFATGLKKNTVCKGLKCLVGLNVITQKGNDIAKIYRINKDFNAWKPLPKKVTLPKKGIIVPQKGNLAYPKKGTTKESITKEKRKGPVLEKKPELSPEDLEQRRKTLAATREDLVKRGIIKK